MKLMMRMLDVARVFLGEGKSIKIKVITYEELKKSMNTIGVIWVNHIFFPYDSTFDLIVQKYFITKFIISYF